MTSPRSLLPLLGAVLLLAAAAQAVPLRLSSTPVLENSVVIGPAVNYTLSWTANTSNSTLSVCAAAKADSSNYIALGFSAAPHSQMSNADIVLGYLLPTGTGKVQVLYSNAASGYPAGTPTLEVSATSVTQINGQLELCFQRSFSSGHTSIADNGAVIWAVGPVTAGVIGYHGSDAKDPTGKTQMHRSDETPAINWVSGH